MAAKFTDPTSWAADNSPFRAGLEFGLSSDSYIPDTKFLQYNLREPHKAWLASILATRLLVQATGKVRLESADVHTMYEIHRQLGATVLADEHIHLATPVVPPKPEEGSLSLENNLLWLSMLGGIGMEIGWPIMAERASGPDQQQPIPYSLHDARSWHPVNSALFPKQGQDVMTSGAAVELEVVRTKGADYILVPAGMTLSRLRDLSDTSERYGLAASTGIAKLDRLSNVGVYVPILQYAMHCPVAESPQERMALLDSNSEVAETFGYKGDLGIRPQLLRWRFADVLDLINLYERGRLAPEDTVDGFMAGFWTGTARVAAKIQGTYHPPTHKPKARLLAA